MTLSATGKPVVTQDDTEYTAYHAQVEFAAPVGDPWTAQKVHFSAKAPDGNSVGLPVDLLNDACDGPRRGIPEAIWKVVHLAATSAGDVGLTYVTPDA
ncbi:hypothetical protein ACFC8F_03125 [Streptomyces hydrogenans]|uniref:hypothetical protein n=1 Tax=Streptomyces hydrogenans TaxID=1873719 RepID=UPI0035DD1402